MMIGKMSMEAGSQSELGERDVGSWGEKNKIDLGKNCR